MPDGEHEEDRERDEQCDGDDEPQSCACAFPFAPELRVPPRTVVVVRAVDRLGIDGWVLGGRGAGGGLGHAGSLVPLSPCFDHTFVGSG